MRNCLSLTYEGHSIIAYNLKTDIVMGAVLEYAVKKNKSHRRFSLSINFNTLEEQFRREKKVANDF